METVGTISDHILDTTSDINLKFPELSKYIDEMPVTIPDTIDPQIDKKNLTEYENSLLELVKKYATSHHGRKI